MTTYQKYKELMRSIEYSYHGVELSHAIALRAWAVAKGEDTFKTSHYVKMFCAMDVKRLNLLSQNGLVSTFTENYRKDHFELYNKVINSLTIKPTVTNLFELKNKVSLHLFVDIYLILKVFCKLRIIDIKLTDKIHLGIEYAYLVNTIKELDKLDFSKVKKYLCMCHVLSIENLLTQYFKNKNITTYSLQEGIYLVYKKNKVLGCIAYELFETDHLLCWGQYTKDEYINYGIESSRINVAGYPKINQLKPLDNKNKYKKCLVLLAGPIFGDVNDKLLKLLTDMRNDFEFTLKSHPANYALMLAYANSNQFNIVPKSETVSACFESGRFDFCIAVNTTAYYEAWMAGIPCVRYYDDRFDNFAGFDDLFSDKLEFQELIRNYRRKSKNEDEIIRMLEYSIGFGINNYDDILNN